MMAPLRRTPWATHSDLVTLHTLLFSEPSSRSSIEKGLGRLSIYLSSPSCPLFFPLLHGLLTASLLPHPPQSPGMHLSTRLTYAMAIVRFINGMIDPLQSGAYARPIASLARQLGIPPVLVQMRHQATHEDLPSLAILRDGVERCVAYLRDAAMGPLVYPSSSTSADGLLARQQEARDDLLRRSSALIRQYKKLMKLYFRERNSKTIIDDPSASHPQTITTGITWTGARDLRAVLRDMESLLEDSPLEDEVKRDLLAGLLLSPGHLISSTGKKRIGRDDSMAGGIPRLPLSSMRIWTPMLRLLASRLDVEVEDEDVGEGEQEEEEARQERRETEGLESSGLAGALALKCIDLLRLDERSASSDRTHLPGSEADGMDMTADYLDVPSLDPALALDHADLPASFDKARSRAEADAESMRIITASWLVWLWGDFSSSSLGGKGEKPGSRARKGPATEDGQVWLSSAVKRGLARVIMGGAMDGLRPGLRMRCGLSNVAEALGEIDATFDSFNALTREGLKTRAKRGHATERHDGMVMDDEFGASMAQMEARLRAMQETTNGRRGRAAKGAVSSGGAEDGGSTGELAIAPGWKLADDRWKESPIGVWR